MLYNNLFLLAGNALLFAYSVVYENDTSLQRILDNPTLLRDTVIISLCGAIGQIFIYFTISVFDNYKVSIITTSRKCLTVVLSNFLFNHQFSTEQWIGASMVMSSTCAEVYLGSKRKQKT